MDPTFNPQERQSIMLGPKYNKRSTIKMNPTVLLIKYMFLGFILYFFFYLVPTPKTTIIVGTRSCTAVIKEKKEKTVNSGAWK